MKVFYGLVALNFLLAILTFIGKPIVPLNIAVAVFDIVVTGIVGLVMFMSMHIRHINRINKNLMKRETVKNVKNFKKGMDKLNKYQRVLNIFAVIALVYVAYEINIILAVAVLLANVITHIIKPKFMRYDIDKDLKNDFSYSILKSNIKKKLKYHNREFNKVIIDDNNITVVVAEVEGDVKNKANAIEKIIRRGNALYTTKIIINRKSIFNMIDVKVYSNHDELGELLKTIVVKEILETVQGCERK